MSVTPPNYKPLEQAKPVPRGEENPPPTTQRRFSLPSDGLEMQSDGSGTGREWCIMRCFTWVYNLFASLFRRLCCKTENEEGVTEQQGKSEELRIPSPLTQPQEVREAPRSIPESLDAPLLPAQKASLFFKAFAAQADLSAGSARDAFIAFAQSGKPGIRIQLWILYRLACKALNDRSYEQVIKTYLAFADAIAETTTKELGDVSLMGLNNNHYQRLPEIFRKQLGIESLHPQKKEEGVENSFKRTAPKGLRKNRETENPHKEKSVESVLQFTRAYLKEPSNAALLEEFVSFSPLTQLCILYRLLPLHGPELFVRLSSALSSFVQEECSVTTEHEYVQLKETFKEIITLFLPDAVTLIE